MFYRNPSFLLLTALSSFSFDLHAQDENTPEYENRLEHLTVIGVKATRGAELGGALLTEIPVSAFVVNREEIERIRFVDPDDFLDRIPGETQVRNLRIPDGGKPYTIPLVDGLPLDNPYSGATSDINRVNSYDIERIEILKGPASALYGNNAFGGVVNVVTRDAPDDIESRAFVEGGDFGHRRAGINSGGSFTEKLGYFFDANLLRSDGIRDNFEGESLNGVPDAERNERDSISGKLQFRPSAITDLSVRYEYLKSDEVTATDIPQSSFDVDQTLILAAGSGDPDVSFEERTTHALYFKGEHEYETGVLNFGAVVRDSETEGDGRFSDPEIEDFFSTTFKLWYRHDFHDHNITFGGEQFDGDTETEVFDDVSFSSATGFQNTDLRISALFAQSVLSLSSAVDLTLGLRYEEIVTSSNFVGLDEGDGIEGRATFDDLSPKLGLTYQFNSDNLFWLGVSEGFLAPAPDDLYDPEEGDATLAPEEATNIEFGLRGRVGRFAYNSSVYHTEIENFLFTQEIEVLNDAGVAEERERTSNAAQITVRGVESVLEFEFSPRWRAGLTHTYAKNEFDSFVQSTPGAPDDFSGNELSRSPEHHLNVRIAWLPIDGLIIELENDFNTSYYTNDDNGSDPLGKFRRDERVDLRVNYAVDNWEFWFDALNLTDTVEDRVSFSGRRGERSFRLIDGRTAQLGMSYTF